MARKIQLKNKSGEILHPETEVSAITDLVANPGGSGLTELTSLKIGDTSYRVAANPDMSGYATTQYVDNRMNAVLGGENIAQAYDTMKEIADYLDEHDNYIGELQNTTAQADMAATYILDDEKRVNPLFIPKHFYLENLSISDSRVIGYPIDVEFTADLSQDYYQFKIYKHEGVEEMFKVGYSWDGAFEKNVSEVLDSNLVSQAEVDKFNFYFKMGRGAGLHDQIGLVLDYEFEPGSHTLPIIGYVDPVVPSSTDLADGATLITTSNISNHLPSVPTRVGQLTNDAGYITSTALNGYALQANVPSALSDLNNDVGYITGSALENYALESYVDNAIGNISIPSAVSDLTNDTGFITASSLTGLASETYVDNKFASVPIPTLVSQLTNDMGYITSHQSLANYATKSYVDTAVGGITVPTKTSDLTNDSGFLTQHQSLSGLATESYVDNAINEILGEGQISSNFDTIKEVADYLTQHGSDYTALVSAVNGKADVEDIPTKVSDLTNDAGYLTQHQSLSGYATESYVNTAVAGVVVPTKTSDLTNDSGFLTQHQSLSGLATETYVDEAIADIDIPTKTSDLTNDSGFLTAHQSLDAYALKSEIPAKVSDITNDTGFITASALQPYALAVDVPTKVSDLQNDSGFITSHQDISGKQDVLTAGTGISISNNVISVSGIQGISYEVISEFPQSGAAGKIYLKSKGGRNKDVYEEYIWVNNDFELIGSTEIDLSGYAQTANLATVATSGDYDDLINKPTLFSGDYTDLTNKPTLFSGDYTDLTNKPTIPTKTSDLTNDSNFLSPGFQIFSYADFAGKYTFPGRTDTILTLYPDKTFKLELPDSIITALDTEQNASHYNSTGTYRLEYMSNAIDNCHNPFYLASFDNADTQAKFGSYTQFYAANTTLNGTQFPKIKQKATYGIPFFVFGNTWTDFQNWTPIDWAFKSDIPAAVDTSSFLTSSDLSGYALSSAIPTATSDLTNDSGFLTSSDISIPANISDLNDDVGIITSSDLSNYVTSSQLTTALSSVSGGGAADEADIAPFNISKLRGLYHQNENTSGYNHSGYNLKIENFDKGEVKTVYHTHKIMVYDNLGDTVYDGSNYCELREGGNALTGYPANVPSGWTYLGYICAVQPQDVGAGSNGDNIETYFFVFKGSTTTSWTNRPDMDTDETYIITNPTYGEFFFYSDLFIPNYTAGSGITISNGVISSSATHVWTYEECAGHWEVVGGNPAGYYVDVNTDGSYLLYMANYNMFVHGDITLDGSSLTLSNTQEQMVASMLDGGSFALTITSDGKFRMSNSNFGTYEKALEPGIREKFGEPDLTTDGTYVLKATVSNGAVTYSWVLEA